MLLAGFLARLLPAFWNYFNPDEAMHYLLSIEPSFAATYQASKAVTHPPLLILILHYWRILGASEWWLRMPSVLASIGFCWFTFAWTRRALNQSVALISLLLLLFSPSLIVLSAEIRQYALLWFFCAASLYFFDEAILDASWHPMLLSALALQFAILSHYSAFLFALVFGIYALLRMTSAKPSLSISALWLTGQAAAVSLSAFLIRTHVLQIKHSGLAQTIAETYLRKSIYQPDKDSVLRFIARSNLRLFHYFFSQGAVGALALALFITGIVLLATNQTPRHSPRGPASRQLAFLFALPFLFNCALGVAAVYPYGGTRHDSYLALFAMPAIAIAVDHWKPSATSPKLIAVLAILLICNLFRTPMGEFIRWRDQRRGHMLDAVATFRRLPPNSTILADTQGAMLLSYYLCDAKVAQFFQPYQPFSRANCGSLSVISIDPDRWLLKAETLPADLETVRQMFALPPASRLWFFQAGWDVDKDASIRQALLRFGCPAPQKFGRNILLCPITLSQN